jgi:hypothetical protein
MVLYLKRPYAKTSSSGCGTVGSGTNSRMYDLVEGSEVTAGMPSKGIFCPSSLPPSLCFQAATEIVMNYHGKAGK